MRDDVWMCGEGVMEGVVKNVLEFSHVIVLW